MKNGAQKNRGKKAKLNNKKEPESSVLKGRLSLVCENQEYAMKLACSMLRRWRARLEHDELVSVVNLALCQAAVNFDDSRNIQFSTFLFYHIKGKLIRTIERRRKQVLLAEALSPKEWESSGSLPFEVINSPNPERLAEHREILRNTSMVIQKLPKLEQEIFRRTCLEEENVTTVARELGFSRSHISRLKSSILAELRALVENDTSSFAKAA